MRSRSPLNCPVRSVVAFVLALPLSISAQTPSPTPSPSNSERVIIADSYYPNAETESANRVVVWTAEFMEQGGANTPIEALRQLPFFVGTTRTENDSSGGDGTASINLFGLGPGNVLTLINGRRAFGFSDINSISIGALSRTEFVDINIYGSDSAGGIVNFILLNGPGEKPYEGAELHALYGNTTASDAHVRQVYLRGGVQGLDGKVSITVTGEYYSRANLFARDREISRSADLSNDATGLGLGGPNNNSAAFAGRISLSGGEQVLVDLTNNAPTGASYRAFDVPPGTDPSRFNARAYTPAIPEVEKSMFFVAGRYKIFQDALQVYGDILHSKTKQDNAVSPTPISFTSMADGLDDVRNSPFNPFSGNTLTSLQYRTVQELGLRKSFYDRDNYRYVAGLNGDFNFFDPLSDNKLVSRFGYDIGFVYERVDQLRIDSGDLRLSALRNQIRLAVFDPFIGQFATPAGIAPVYTNGIQTGAAAYDNIAAAQAASYIGHSYFDERDWLTDAKFNAHLFPKLINGGFDVAGGYERRQRNAKLTPDSVQASDAVGFSSPGAQKFREEVESWFFELSFPLVPSTMEIPFVRSLDVDLVWRCEQFTETNLLPVVGSPLMEANSFANENPQEDFGGTPTLSLRYQPNPDLMFRASWRQSIRPPTFEEQFAQIPQTLTPEKTDAYSAGVVWSTPFVPGVLITVDGYQLFTTDVMVAGKRLVEGVTAMVSYDIPTENWGRFTFSGGWNHFFTWKGQANPMTPTVSFLGNYDNQTPPFMPGAIPWNKGYLRGDWALKGFDFVMTGNYIGDFRDDPSFDTIVREHPRNVPSYITLDLQLSYEWKKPEFEPIDWQEVKNASARTESSSPSIWQRLLWNTKMMVGVNNAFDRNPPTVLAALNDNYDTSLYSIRNRYWYVAVSKKF